MSRSPEAIDHALLLVSSANTMRSENFICDFQIKVGKKTFNVHRLILAANSGYFKSLFSSNMKEATDGYVAMDTADPFVLEQCINYMYTSLCDLQTKSVTRILKTANFLQILQLEKRCFEFLTNNLSSDNALAVLNLARAFNYKCVTEAAERIILENLDIVMMSELFPQIPQKDLQRYIAGKDHKTAWKAITIWCCEKEVKFPELVRQLDLPTYPFTFILKVVLEEPLILKSPDLKTIAIQALFSDYSRLEKQIDLDNCFLLNNLAQETADEEPLDVINWFMTENFQFLINDPEFTSLSKERIFSLLTSPEVKPEESKWDAIMTWVYSDYKHREIAFPDLFRTIQLRLLTVTFVKMKIRPERLVNTDLSCMEFLADYLLEFAEESVLQTELLNCQSTIDGEKLCLGAAAAELLKQPRGGKCVRDPDGFLRVHFPIDIYKGVIYAEFNCRYLIPDEEIEDRILQAFHERQLFKILVELGSDEGDIVTDDIPLNPAFRDTDGDDEYQYLETLREALTKKGF